MLELILVLITIIWLFFASGFDIKTREIPDWLSYSLLIIAIVFHCILYLSESIYPNLKYLQVILALFILGSIIYHYENEKVEIKSYIFLIISSIIYFLINSIVGSSDFLLYTVSGMLIFFVIGEIMFLTKQWGGGDAKLLTGLGAVFATYPSYLMLYFQPNLNFPFLFILFINILIAGALYGIVWTFVLAIKNKKEFLINLKQILHLKKMRIAETGIFTVTISLLLVVFVLITDLRMKLIVMVLVIIPMFFMYIFIITKAIEKISFIKTIPISQLTEGDWITQDIIYKNKKIYSKKSLFVTQKQIDLFKKLKIKTVVIKEGIPFVPSFLIGVLLSLILGNIIYF